MQFSGPYGFVTGKQYVNWWVSFKSIWASLSGDENNRDNYYTVLWSIWTENSMLSVKSIWAALSVNQEGGRRN